MRNLWFKHFAVLFRDALGTLKPPLANPAGVLSPSENVVFLKIDLKKSERSL